MTTVNMQEAKTQLSKLVKLTINGEEVIIANRGVPVVRLVPYDRPKKRELGFLKGKVPDLPDSFFDPLPEEELELWGL
jgi:prevent-host-death family protein